MKALFALSAIALTTFGVTGATSVRETLQKDYNSMSAAFKNKNISVYENLLAPNYTAYDVPTKRTIKRAAIIADFKNQMKMVQMQKWDRRIVSVKSKGQKADVVVAGHFVGTVNYNGKSHTFDLKSNSDDIWQQSKGQWKILSSRILTRDAKMDGQSIPSGG